jgi:SAM-dependent methyltransferase
MAMLSTATWYSRWFDSPYYHKLYFEREGREAENFIRRLLDLLKPSEAARFLDIACGRGRHARILADMGFDVTGIDLSESSIEYALQYERDNLHFYQHDLRLPFRTNYFDYAVNFFSSFGYFKTEREHYNAIRTVSGSLHRHGIFVIDYLNTHYTEDHLIHKSERVIDGVTYLLTKWYDEHHFYKKIVIEDEQLDEPIEFLEKAAKFSLGDFNDMLAYHNMQIQQVYGDYNFNMYHVRNSPRMIMIASKISDDGV